MSACECVCVFLAKYFTLQAQRGIWRIFGIRSARGDACRNLFRGAVLCSIWVTRPFLLWSFNLLTSVCCPFQVSAKYLFAGF